jgi:hypothetical protein
MRPQCAARPVRGPAEIAHQLARQAEGKIEAAEPRAGPRKECLEGAEVLKPLDLPDLENIPGQKA